MANSNLSISITAVDKASKTIGDIGRAFGNMKASTLVTSGALVAFGAKSIQAFTESESAQTKLSDAFAKFPKLADTNVAALNRLNSEMQRKTRFDDEAYASAEASLAQFDLTGQQLKDLIPLVADFAAKTGQELPDAAVSVGRALLGQGRALKAVGIDFKDTGSVAGNFSQIMGGLRTQVGGFAEKEGQTAAGKVAILKNEFNDLQEKVGSLLVPAIGQLIAVITPLVDGFNALPAPVQNATILLVGFSAAAYLVGPKIIAAAGALKVFAGEVALTGRVLSSFGIGMGAVAAPIAAVAAPLLTLIGVLVAVGTTMSNQKKIVDDTAAAMNRFKGTLKPADIRKFASEATSAQKAVQDYGSAVSVADGINDSWNRGIDAIRSSLTGQPSLLDAATDSFNDQKEAVRNLDYVIKSVSNTTGLSIGKVQEYADKFGIDLSQGVANASSALRDQIQAEKDQDKTNANAQRSTGKLAEAQKILSDKAASATDKINALKDAIQNLDGGQIGLAKANDRYAESLDRANQSIAENGRTLDINTEAGRANRESLINIAEAARDQAAAEVEAAGNTEQGQRRASAALSKARDDFIRTAESAGYTRRQARRLADQYGLIPKNVATNITVRARVSISKQAQRTLDQLGAISSGTVGVQNAVFLALGGAVSGLQRRATGGPVNRGQAYVVGEQRPELFVPDSSGVIVPSLNAQTFNNQGQPSVVITGGTFVGSTKADAARWMSDIIREGKARGLVMS